MDKKIITIGVAKNTTQDEIKNIRQNFKNSELYKDHKLNIIVSGNEDIQQNLAFLLLDKIKS